MALGSQSDRPAIQTLRSPLGRARGLGAARAGLTVWWAERLTSVALVPLTLWFVVVVLHLSGLPRAAVGHFAANPVNAALLLALVLITFHHMQLGLRVVVEDYVHREPTRLAGLLAIRAAALILALIAAVAVLKLALAG
jgi:succinate dehydrogenase / fumarate reductase membrane anchor subunit